MIRMLSLPNLVGSAYNSTHASLRSNRPEKGAGNGLKFTSFKSKVADRCQDW